MNRAPASDATERSRFTLHDAADVSRLMRHLLTHAEVPLVDIRIDSLPPVLVQLTQHRLARIAEAPTGGLGAALAAITFLGLTIVEWTSVHTMLWTLREFWQHVGVIVLAALCAGVFGVTAGAVWRRLHLIVVLRQLRRRLASGKTLAEPAPYLGRLSPEPALQVSAAIDDDEAADAPPRRRARTWRRRRPSVSIHSTADLRPLVLHLLTHWRLPRVHINVGGVAPLEVQRAQHRIVLLSENCHCVLGASLAGATVLAGSFSVTWISTYDWDWYVPVAWGPLALVALAALCAAALGFTMDMIWSRVQLLRVLRSVRHQLGA